MLGTSFDDIYDVFLTYVIDEVEWINPYDDETEQEHIERIQSKLDSLIMLALPKVHGLQHSKETDRYGRCFLEQLNDKEIDIIALCMLREYYRSKLNFIVTLKHNYSDKFWKSHDKSAMTNQYRQMIKETELEIRNAIIDLSYYDGDTGKFNGWAGGK